MDLYSRAKEYYRSELESIKKNGLWKDERIITCPQNVRINIKGHQTEMVLSPFVRIPEPGISS